MTTEKRDAANCPGSVLKGMDTDWLDEGTDRSRDEWEDAQERREDYARDQRESDEREAGVCLGR